MTVQSKQTKGKKELKLTLKQQRFADYYIQTGNATKAAIEAGYSKKTAYAVGAENLKKPQIKKHIRDRLAEMDAKRVADAAEVLRFLTSSMRGDLKEEVVMVVGVGDGCSTTRTVQKQVSAKDRIRAAELLAKRYGLDKPAETNGDAQITFIFDRGNNEH